MSASELFAVLLMVAVVPLAYTSHRHAHAPNPIHRAGHCNCRACALGRVHDRVTA